MRPRFNFISLSKVMTAIAVTSVLVACGGSSGGSSGSSTTTSSGSGSSSGSSGSSSTVNYAGPAPRDDDVQNFRSYLWSNIAQDTRCGGCHVVGGAGAPAFADDDDINTAYDATLSLVNLSNPSASRLVTKVASEGHNCWLSSDTVCANQLSGWITDWASAGGSTSFLGALGLTDPTIRTVGDSKQFPALADDGTAFDFESTIYPLTSQHCSACHSETSALRQQPYFGSSDVQVAYEGAMTKINLEDDGLSVANALSRLTVRLRDESHHCWDGSCTNSANAMHAAIQAFSNNISPTTVDPTLVTSRALSLDDGLTASSGGGRAEANVIAKWDFSAGLGSTAYDISGIDPALDLNISGNVEWLAAGGVRINDGKLQGSTTTSAKLYDRITSSGEYSVEAWVVPLNVTQDGPARIVTYSGASDRRNFMMGQTLYDYNFHARASTTDADGQPALSTPMADEVLQATLQHVVMTYSATEGRKIFVNGENVTEGGDADATAPGNFNSWDRNFALVIGDEVTNDNPWQGSVRFLAIHDRAMSEADIQTNYDIGVGQKFYLLFSISDHVAIPRSYIVLQVEQFDDYGYLFNEPFFVTLEEGATISDFAIQGMRVGVNGSEASVGQAYANIDTTVTQASVDAGEGRQILSNIGTIIGVDQGANIDEFFLTFDQLGSSSYVRIEATPTATVPVPSTEEQSDIGLKTFDEINEALAALTGISKTNANVATTFAAVRQQMPVDPAIGGFVSAHQLGVTQLAVSYCNELVAQEAGGSATGYFPGFSFSNNVAASFGAVGATATAGRSQIISPLLDNLLANTVTISDQPTFVTSELELNNLIDTLIDNCDNDGSCTQNSTRAQRMVTAVCSATFSSAMMLLQ